MEFEKCAIMSGFHTYTYKLHDKVHTLIVMKCTWMHQTGNVCTEAMDTKLCITGSCNRFLGLKIKTKKLFCWELQAIATFLQLPLYTLPSTTKKS